VRIPSRDEAGFTLIELLIAVTLMGLASLALTGAIFSGLNNTGKIADRLSRSHDLQQAAAFFTTDAQSAEQVYTSRIAQSATDLTDVTFPDDTTNGWTVGGSGAIAATTDGGTTWDLQDSTVTTDLLAIAFVPTSVTNAWVVGKGGVILRTTDGGDTWTAQTSGTTNDLQDVYFKDSSNGIVVGSGGKVLTTSNSGTTWTTRTTGTSNDLFAVGFRDSVNGLVAGAAGMTLRTADFGSTWAAQTGANHTTTANTLRDIYLKDASNGWAVGDGGAIVYCSSNCTSTTSVWASSTSPAGSVDLTAISAVDTTHMWATGKSASGATTIINCGASCKSVNPWTAQATTTKTPDLLAIWALDATHVWAVGVAGTLVSFSTNRWSPQDSPVTTDLNAIDMVDASNGWAVGNGGVILRTSDGGGTWTTQTSGTTNDLLGVYARSTSRVYAVGKLGTLLYSSGNGTWIAQTSGSVVDLSGVFSYSDSRVWTVGATGVLLRCTSNCTLSTAVWALKTTGTTNDLAAVWYDDGTVGCGGSCPGNEQIWIAGKAGTIRACSSSSGTCSGTTPSFSAQTSGTTNDITSLTVATRARLWASGKAGTLLTNSGTSTWTVQTSGTTSDLLGVATVPSGTSNAWAVGALGAGRVTSDIGVTWAQDATGVGVDLLGVSAASATQQWAVGKGGTIISTVTPLPIWTAIKDDNLVSRPAPVCPDAAHGDVALGATPIISFFWSDSTGDTAATWIIGVSGNGDRQLIRQFCTRAPDTLPDDPFDYKSQTVVVHSLPAGDPTLGPACLTTNNCSTPPTLISLTFPAVPASAPGGAAPGYIVQAVGRSA
jgi:prepilin-type N-terminal cleavage/methylation domain-containing protein